MLLAFLTDEERDDHLDRIELKPHGPNTLTERTKLERDLDAVRQRGIAVEDLVRQLAPMLQNTATEITARIGYH